MTAVTKQAVYIEEHAINSFSDCQQSPCNKRLKRPRGRPPDGAVLADNGTYILPPAAIEAAAERVIKHRTACRERYVATRKGLRMAKPELFAKRQWSANQQPSSPSKKENDERQGATGTMG